MFRSFTCFIVVLLGNHLIDKKALAALIEMLHHTGNGNTEICI